MSEHEAGIGGVVAVLVIGVIFAGFGGSMVYDHYRITSNAEQVEATVINTSVETSYDHEEAVYEHSPSVTYRFTYEGEEHTNDNVFVGHGDPTYGSEAEAGEVIDDYSQGETVTAHVPVGDPSRAFLINESSLLFDWLLPVAAAVFGVLAIVSGLKGTRQALFSD